MKYWLKISEANRRVITQIFLWCYYVMMPIGLAPWFFMDEPLLDAVILYPWIVLIALGAMFNAMMDSLEHERFVNSRFSKLNPLFWDKAVSSQAKRIVAYPLNAWHMAKSTMVICLCGAVVIYTPIRGMLIDFIFAGLLWNFSFNLFYNRIFKK